MEITFQIIDQVFDQIRNHELFKWSLILAQAVAFIIVILHYFRQYYAAFNSGKRIGVYEILRPVMYLVLLSSFPLVLDSLDQVTDSVESALQGYENSKLSVTVEEKAAEIQGDDSSVEPPPADSNQQTAKSISKIWNVINHPGIILIKILDWLVYLIDAMIFAFSMISRAGFLFVLRFMAPFAIVASIFEHYRKYFWNWLKIYAIVYLSVYIFFIINTFSDAFLDATWEMKINHPGSGMIDAYDHRISLLMFCMVLVKTFLYAKSIQLMYKVYNSNV